MGVAEPAERGRKVPNWPLPASDEAPSKDPRLFSKQFRKEYSANFALTAFREVRPGPWRLSA